MVEQPVQSRMESRKLLSSTRGVFSKLADQGMRGSSPRVPTG